MYYVSRLLGRINVNALARYEGRDVVGKTADQLVADAEATYVRKAQQEVLNSLGLAFVLNLVIFFGVGALALWFLSSALFGLIIPEPPDPLAF